MTTEIYKKRTKKYDIWIGFNNEGKFSEPNYLTEVYVKTKNGIKHLVNWYHKKDPKQAIIDAEKRGFFSKKTLYTRATMRWQYR